VRRKRTGGRAGGPGGFRLADHGVGFRSPEKPLGPPGKRRRTHTALRGETLWSNTGTQCPNARLRYVGGEGEGEEKTAFSTLRRFWQDLIVGNR
jgi:hypothetical protein